MADNTQVLEVAGLQTSNATFSASPPGSLLLAENVMIVAKGVGQPRNGQNRAYTMPTAAEIAWALTEFSGSIIASYASSKTSTSYGLGIGAAPITGFTGTFNPVDDTGSSTAYGRMKFGQADQFLYFCTTTGPKALETLAGQPREAGLQRMPDPLVAMSSASGLGTGAGLAYGAARAYRTVLRLPTSTGRSLLSPPSGAAAVTNALIAPPGAMVRAANVVTVTLPGVTQTGVSNGDTFTVDPGEAGFPNTSETKTSGTGNIIVYADVGANGPNTLTQNLDTGPRPVLVTATLPADATEETPLRIYRSRDTTPGNVTPDEEMFLVTEIFPSGSDISNGYLTYLDTTPQSVTNDPLYTNPQTGAGISQANFQPPVYRDLAWWGSRMWYANTTALQTMNLQMLGVGAPDGVQNNDTLTVAGQAFTFKTTPAGATDVQIYSDSTAAVNIQRTTQQLIVIFNDWAISSMGSIRAYYNSSPLEPGRFVLQAITYAQAAFGVVASRPATWFPALDASSAVDSVAERIPNGLSYSKLSQAEAVPLVNFTAAGAANYPIARVLALQNALLVFKQGDGIWAVTGGFPFQVQQISTANLIAIDCATVFADAAWAYTDQGILRVTDAGGALVVSRAIETELNAFRDELPTETADYSFAVAYETERRVMFFVPVALDDDDRPVLRAYCYNNATDSWTRYMYEAFSGIVGPSVNKLFLGTYDAPWATARITQERKGNGHLDTADEQFSNTVATSTHDTEGNRIIRLASGNDVEAGDGITQGDFRTKIKAIRTDLGIRWFELWEDVPLTAAACVIYKHFEVKPMYQPIGAPTSRKSLPRFSWLFKPGHYAALGGKSLVMTDQIQAEKEIPCVAGRGFGLTPFGEGPFGDPTPMVVDINPIDPKWSNAAQFFVGFLLDEVWVKFKLQGLTATLNTQDAAAGRGTR